MIVQPSEETPENAEPPALGDSSDPFTQTLLARAARHRDRELTQSWRHSACFLALFVFLYAALGTSLTLDLSTTAGHVHKSIAYALEAIPVLIAFSGYFVAILYLFHCKSSSRRAESWEQVILTIEAQNAGGLFSAVNARSRGTSDYSATALPVALALFIGLTWLVIYNYLTFTTSGVIGSVISLFISTMTWVILDIQLLKPSRDRAGPAESQTEKTTDSGV